MLFRSRSYLIYWFRRSSTGFAMSQPGFFDLICRYESLDAKGDPLVALNQMVPWESFRPRLLAALQAADQRATAATRKSPAGRKPCDEVLIFKVLVLQSLYNLGDDSVEYQIRDRLSFMRFLGLGLHDRVPDAKTIWLYREALAKTDAVRELFDGFDGYLRQAGYAARGGQSLICQENLANAQNPVSSYRDWRLGGFIGIGVGAALLATGVTLLAVAPRSAISGPGGPGFWGALTPEVVAAQDGLRLRLGGRF